LTAAAEIAARAAELVAGERAKQHGDIAEGFARTARLWSAYLGVTVTDVDAAHMLALLKIGRAQGGALNEDDWVDGAGYLACAAQIATGRAA